MRILSLLFVLLLASVGAQAQDSAWSEYRSPEGRYRVEMPGTPKIERVSINLNSGGTAPMIQAIVEVSDAAYLAAYTDYAPGTFGKQTPQQTLLNVRDGSVAKHKLSSDRAITVAGFPGREYLIEQADGAILLTRSVLVGNRLYQIIFAYSSGAQQPPGARRFVDSFNVLSQ